VQTFGRHCERFPNASHGITPALRGGAMMKACEPRFMQASGFAIRLWGPM
jgi:hypothetical protein